MTSNKQILDGIGIELIEEADSRLADRNINNTGATSESLDEEATENNLKIKGVGTIRFINDGRRPGKFAPPNVIQDWVRSKLNITDEKEVKQVAFLINRKLAVEGNRMFIDKTKGLQLDEVVKLGIDKINERIPENIIIGVKSEINKIFVGV